MSSHRFTRTAGLALSIAALGAPSALADPPQQNFVSPDAQDAAGGSNAQQSLASPDARDAADGRGTYSAPEVTVVKVPAVSSGHGSDNGGGISWPDAGIGAGGVLGIILLAGGTTALVTHRARRRTMAAQPTVR